MVWCGVMWCGVVWCGVVLVWCGVVWCGVSVSVLWEVGVLHPMIRTKDEWHFGS